MAEIHQANVGESQPWNSNGQSSTHVRKFVYPLNTTQLFFTFSLIYTANLFSILRPDLMIHDNFTFGFVLTL